jgi:PAS domain S-box-containing protein
VLYGSVQDVSEIRRAEQELLARERMLTAILQNALEAVIITDSSGAILVWNRAAEEIFGWHGDDVIGKAVADTLVSEDQRWVFSSGIRGLKRRINRRVELVGRRRDGSEFPAEVTLTAVRSNGVYFAAFVRDVSEQKRTERENARFSSLVQHSTDAIVSTDLEGVVESWNPAAVPIYGRTAEQMIGKNLSEVLQPERLKAFLRAMKLIARGETVSLFEYCRPNAKGELIWLAVSCSPMRDAAGEVVGCASIIRDVTELRRAADAIRQHEETQRANRAKSEFLSRMSHELRTPLNSVLGFAQLIEMRSPDGPHLESARHIAKAGRHLLSLINEILDISRIETGRLVFEHEPFDLGLVASEAADIVRMQAEARGITLHIQVDPGTRVIGDRQRTTQILINLLSNAVKFNRECGSVEMDAVCLDDRCRVTVCDTGFGIELERLDVLFEPFERLGADQRRIEGTGLGLTLSRKYAEAMGGSLTLAYTGPEGSAFCLELPSGQRAYADSH